MSASDGHSGGGDEISRLGEKQATSPHTQNPEPINTLQNQEPQQTDSSGIEEQKAEQPTLASTSHAPITCPLDSPKDFPGDQVQTEDSAEQKMKKEGLEKKECPLKESDDPPANLESPEKSACRGGPEQTHPTTAVPREFDENPTEQSSESPSQPTADDDENPSVKLSPAPPAHSTPPNRSLGTSPKAPNPPATHIELEDGWISVAGVTEVKSAPPPDSRGSPTDNVEDYMYGVEWPVPREKVVPDEEEDRAHEHLIVEIESPSRQNGLTSQPMTHPQSVDDDSQESEQPLDNQTRHEVPAGGDAENILVELETKAYPQQFDTESQGSEQPLDDGRESEVEEPEIQNQASPSDPSLRQSQNLTPPQETDGCASEEYKGTRPDDWVASVHTHSPDPPRVLVSSDGDTDFKSSIVVEAKHQLSDGGDMDSQPSENKEDAVTCFENVDRKTEETSSNSRNQPSTSSYSFALEESADPPANLEDHEGIFERTEAEELSAKPQENHRSEPSTASAPDSPLTEENLLSPKAEEPDRNSQNSSVAGDPEVPHDKEENANISQAINPLPVLQEPKSDCRELHSPEEKTNIQQGFNAISPKQGEEQKSDCQTLPSAEQNNSQNTNLFFALPECEQPSRSEHTPEIIFHGFSGLPQQESNLKQLPSHKKSEDTQLGKSEEETILKSKEGDVIGLRDIFSTLTEPNSRVSEQLASSEQNADVSLVESDLQASKPEEKTDIPLEQKNDLNQQLPTASEVCSPEQKVDHHEHKTDEVVVAKSSPPIVDDDWGGFNDFSASPAISQSVALKPRGEQVEWEDAWAPAPIPTDSQPAPAITSAVQVDDSWGFTAPPVEEPSPNQIWRTLRLPSEIITKVSSWIGVKPDTENQWTNTSFPRFDPGELSVKSRGVETTPRTLELGTESLCKDNIPYAEEKGVFVWEGSTTQKALFSALGFKLETRRPSSVRRRPKPKSSTSIFASKIAENQASEKANQLAGQKICSIISELPDLKHLANLI